MSQKLLLFSKRFSSALNALELNILLQDKLGFLGLLGICYFQRTNLIQVLELLPTF